MRSLQTIGLNSQFLLQLCLDQSILMRVLLILTVFLSTVVLSDYAGACVNMGAPCDVKPNDWTPNSCSCHVCLDKSYSAKDPKLGTGDAGQFGMMAQFKMKKKKKSSAVMVTGPRTVSAGTALYVRTIETQKCPPMKNTKKYQSTSQPLASVYFTGPSDQMSAGTHLDSDGVSYYSAYELVFGNYPYHPRFIRRGVDPKSDAAPKPMKDSVAGVCGKGSQFALCTYCYDYPFCVFLPTFRLYIHSLHTLWV